MAKSLSVSGLTIFLFIKWGSQILRLFPRANIIVACMQIGSNTIVRALYSLFHPAWMTPCFSSDRQTVAQLERTESSRKGQPWLFHVSPCATIGMGALSPAPLLAGGEIWSLSRPGGILCFCKSFKRPIFSFAALLSPRSIFFSCSEIHSPSLETWALYRKSLACTSTNGWLLFAVCSSWCCKGIAKNYWLKRKRGKKKG